jgi:hypothetical protein
VQNSVALEPHAAVSRAAHMRTARICANLVRYFYLVGQVGAISLTK